MTAVFDACFEDGGGQMVYTITDPEEASKYQEYAGLGKNPGLLDVADWARTISSSNPLVVRLGNEERPFHVVTDRAPADLVAPYFALLEKLTGYAGEFPRGLEIKPQGYPILGTTLSACLWDRELRYTVVRQAEVWNGMTSQEHAIYCVQREINEALGYQERVREYIPIGNGGTYKINPDYGTARRPEVQPRVTAKWLWEPMAEWWWENKATEAQKDLLRAHTRLHVSARIRGPGVWALNYAGGINIQQLTVEATKDTGFDWDGKGKYARHVSWDEFQALGCSGA